ncbi:hypothetical protein ASG87_18490 [Frateuria sp. Soil773]|uniref:alpha/beta fold hydrolase n=1 Tax=Frateuria sp. Soil773 TaxID=1736407 RepID=UPI0006FAE5E8|nr:alpha/beta fold hydrolase [Frateuria sp. Soil773]KRE91331.1 hypothetical protein ASG87_18490 [Frateuria sp. Soil773]
MPVLSVLGLASALAALPAITTDLPVPHEPAQHVALHCIAPAHPNGESVLFVHGASFPAMLAFGFEFGPGDSWMGFMARRGFLACGLDFLGFGASSRPAAMQAAAAGAGPVTRAPAAARQIALAVDYLRTQRHMATVHLVAHSWGTIPAATYAAGHPGALRSLTLFGPVVPRAQAGAVSGRMAWWGITAQERYRQLRFADVLPPGMVLLEPAVGKAWTAAFEASAPRVPGDPPGELRIPAGPVADIEAAERGSYPYAAGDIKAPVFVVYGDYDTVVDDAGAAAFLARFTGSTLRWRLRIDYGTHVMHLERERHSLYESVWAFLRAAGSRTP